MYACHIWPYTVLLMLSNMHMAFLAQNSQVSFVVAKAPLKSLTIPHLELMAALVVTRLTHFVLKAIPSDTVHMWSDSQIVLHWIKSQKPLPVFVHHHTAEIQSLLPRANWSYCPTSENPTDLLSCSSADVLTSVELHQVNGLHDSSHHLYHHLFWQQK